MDVELSTPESARQLRVGDKVRTGYHKAEARVVRRITKIEVPIDRIKQNVFLASADGGEPCLHCGRPLGRPITAVSATWFVRVEE